ncbi:hypothetical protein GCM10027418_22500 [Mariniluteicoccus endophyticus]
MSLDDVLGPIAAQMRDLPPEAAGAVARITAQRAMTGLSAYAFDAQGAPIRDAWYDVDTDPVSRVLLDDGLETINVEVVRTGDAWNAFVCTSPQISGSPGLTRRVRDVELPFTAPVPGPELNPAQMQALQAAWQQHRGAYVAAAPATEAEIAELESALGFPVPPALRHLLALANGARVNGDVTEESAPPAGWWELLSTTAIAQEYASWSELAGSSIYDGVAQDAGIADVAQLRLLHPGWVPFASDGGGNCLGIDLAPGPRGILGQVLEFGRDLTDGPVLVAPSITDWFIGRRVEGTFPDEAFHDLRESGGDVPPADPSTEKLRVFGGTISAGVLAPPRLKSVLLRGGRIDLAGVRGAPVLAELRLIEQADLDLSPLAGHPSLRLITLEKVAPDAVRGLEALASLPRLESVSAPTELAARLVPLLKDHPTLCQVKLNDVRPLGYQLSILDGLDQPGGPALAPTCRALSGDVPELTPPGEDEDDELGLDDEDDTDGADGTADAESTDAPAVTGSTDAAGTSENPGAAPVAFAGATQHDDRPEGDDGSRGGLDAAKGAAAAGLAAAAGVAAKITDSLSSRSDDERADRDQQAAAESEGMVQPPAAVDEPAQPQPTRSAEPVSLDLDDVPRAPSQPGVPQRAQVSGPDSYAEQAAAVPPPTNDSPLPELEDRLSTMLDAVVDMWKTGVEGQMYQGPRPTPAQIEQYADRLPATLLHLWDRVGFSGFDSGRFWLVDPADWADPANEWTEGLELPWDEERWIPFMRTAFGEMHLYGPTAKAVLKIKPLLLELGGVDAENHRDENEFMLANLISYQPEAFELDDVSGQPLFPQLVRRFGPLQPDMMYTFLPAPVLGGPLEVDRAAVERAVVHVLVLRAMAG